MVVLERDGDTVHRGARKVGGRHELGQRGRAVLERAKDRRGLVNDANAAMIVHRAILASHIVRCRD